MPVAFDPDSPCRQVSATFGSIVANDTLSLPAQRSGNIPRSEWPHFLSGALGGTVGSGHLEDVLNASHLRVIDPLLNWGSRFERGRAIGFARRPRSLLQTRLSKRETE